MTWRKTASAAGGSVAALAVIAATAIPTPVLAQESDATLDTVVADLIPGAQQLPELPGLPGTAGGATTGGDAALGAAFDALETDPMVNRVLEHGQTSATAPDVEVSTAPECAPLIMVAVPGTFETHRDNNPDEPTGLLGSLAEPMRSLGAGFSETYINYDADAGISGTAYAQSVQNGTEKALATILDVQERCNDARVLLSGFSQGADVAGDVAVLIGNGQTAVRPDTMAGVVLFADPQRDENANVLVGTSQPVPELPAVVGEAVEEFMKDPSIAQLQMSTGEVAGIASQLMGGNPQDTSSPSTEKEEQPAEAGTADASDDDVRQSASAAETTGGQSLDTVPTGGFAQAVDTGDVRLVAATADLPPVDASTDDDEATAPEEDDGHDDNQVDASAEETSAARITVDDIDQSYPSEGDDEELREQATGIIVPGATGDMHRPAIYVAMSDDELEDVELGFGQVWATPDNLEVYDQFQEEYTEQSEVDLPADLLEGTQEAVDNVFGDVLNLHYQVGQVYRAGGCEDMTFEECAGLFSGAAGTAALGYQLETLPEDNPQELVTLPDGYLMETQCAVMPATACASTPTDEDSTLPAATMSDIEVANVSHDAEAEADAQAQDSTATTESTTESATESAEDTTASASPSTSAAEPAGEQSRPTEESTAVAGAESSPTEDTEDTVVDSTTTESLDNGQTTTSEQDTATDGTDTTSPSTSAAEPAGEQSRPTEESTAVAGAESSPTGETSAVETPYEGDLDGATTGERSAGDGTEEGAVVDGVDPVTMAAVSGGGVAGQREQDFGDLTGSVVSLCVPGDIVCSLPENSQLARDLVTVGENVTTNLSGVAAESMAGNTRMGGLLAVEGVNTVAQVSGLPPLKLSPETIEMLIQMVAGGSMIAAGDPTGAGVALIAGSIHQMPEALPELYAQLQDIPAIIEGLPKAGDTAARNLGLEKISARLDEGFAEAGLTDITDVGNLPAAAVTAATDLLDDNSGLMELATNPDYMKTGAHSEHGFRGLYVSDETESFTWTQDWMTSIQRMLA